MCAFLVSRIAYKIKVKKLTSREISLPSIIIEAKKLARECELDYKAAIQVDSSTAIEQQLKCRILIFSGEGDNSRFNILHMPQYPQNSVLLLFIGLDNNTLFYT